MAVYYKEYYIIVRHVYYSQFYLNILSTAPDKETADFMVESLGGEAVHRTDFKNLTRWCA